MEYAFAEDEYVVMKAQDVKLDEGKKMSMGRGSELMLTNRNIVYPIKGLTGKVKGYNVYPLSSIRIVDGKPQCRLDASKIMEAKLELSLNDRMVSFLFNNLEGKAGVRAWINAIYEILLGVEAPEEALGKGKFETFMDGKDFVGMFSRAFDKFEDTFDRTRPEFASDITGKCPSCDAPLKGRPGETVVCPHCGTYITL